MIVLLPSYGQDDRFVKRQADKRIQRFSRIFLAISRFSYRIYGKLLVYIDQKGCISECTSLLMDKTKLFIQNTLKTL